MTFLTDEVMATVGTSTRPNRGIVAAYDLRKFATGIDDPNPLFTDRDAARTAGYADVIAPPLFNAAAVRPAPFRGGFVGDGQYETTAPPGLTHLQTMLAGQSWEIVRPSVAGEEIQEVFTTRSITEKQGATGPIVFVVKDSVVSTLAGEVIERYTNTLILREPPPALPPFQGSDNRDLAKPDDLPTTEWDGDVMIKRPDMISLFLFVGAIWAVHRIHWDLPYAQREGLPAPVLPGWMVSCYLAQLAQARAPEGQRLHKIDLRYKGPTYPGDTLRCTAQTSDDGLSVAAENQHGTVNVAGTASFIAA